MERRRFTRELEAVRLIKDHIAFYPNRIDVKFEQPLRPNHRPQFDRRCEEQGPLWVNRVGRAVSAARPVYP